jgi:uncharacterized membrane protein (DUF2068 family)
MDWSLLGCGRSGHVTFAPDEPELREQLSADTAAGTAWRCLRCADFIPGAPGGHGPASSAPSVRRGKEVRSELILRIFAIERFVRALAFLGLAYGLWRFRSARQSISASFNRDLPILRELFSQLGYQIDHSKLVGLVQHALTLSTRSITLLAAGLAAYALVEAIEGTGLWLARRWGEYFAMVATAVGLPLEIYDLTRKVTVTTLIFFAINLALVLYLVLTKRLFGARGGKHAYEARLRSESVLEAAAEAAAASRGVAEGGGAAVSAGVAVSGGAAEAGGVAVSDGAVARQAAEAGASPGATLAGAAAGATAGDTAWDTAQTAGGTADGCVATSTAGTPETTAVGGAPAAASGATRSGQAEETTVPVPAPAGRIPASGGEPGRSGPPS